MPTGHSMTGPDSGDRQPATSNGGALADRITIDVHLGTEEIDQALRHDVRTGLTAVPKELPPKWFYDEQGSALFDKITRLDEYYQTEAERSILADRAAELIALTGPDTIVELGSGTSDKTRTVLDQATTVGVLRRFVPFDVSEEFLRSAAEMLAARYRNITVHGVVGDFDRHLHHIPGGGRRLILLLGGTIGNYRPESRKRFLADIVTGMAPGDHLLVGVDVVKDVARITLAYNDPSGVTAAFNKNVLAVITRQLGADFDLDGFDHVARFDQDHNWIEMLLRSNQDQQITVNDLDLTVNFSEGELMTTEISAKFLRNGFEAELDDAGLEPVAWWADANADFAVSLAVRPPS